MPTNTFFSGTNDGHIFSNDSGTYANARAMATSPSVNNTATVITFGQADFGGPDYYCYEGFVDFDTSAIADTDTVTSATLSLWGQTDASATDFTMEAREWDWGGALTTADVVAGASLSGKTLLASLTTAGLSTSGYNAFTESGTNFQTATNMKTGTVSIILDSSRQTSGTTPTGTEYVSVQSADGANAPKLVVVSSAAGGGATRVPLRSLLGVGT